MAGQARYTKVEKDLLRKELTILKMQITPLIELQKVCEEKGKQSARRWRNAWAYLILGQFGLTQYCTYVAYSWDIVEPFTCIMTFSDAVFAYLFWVFTGNSCDIRGLEEHFGQRKFLKALKKQGATMQIYKSKLEAIERIEERLAKLA